MVIISLYKGRNFVSAKFLALRMKMWTEIEIKAPKGCRDICRFIVRIRIR